METVLEIATQLRHDIHRQPEQGFKEFKTKAKILEALHHIGDVKELAVTGITVDITGTAPPKGGRSHMIALRADMDCLPLNDETKTTHKSEILGLHHACGHDGHVAMLVATGLLVHQLRDRIPNNMKVRLLFQPAEEGPGGAQPMIKEGCLEGVDEVFGIHNDPMCELGTVISVPGIMMGHARMFEISVFGKPGHAAAPHLTVDPIMVSAQIIVGLQSIVARSIPPAEMGVVTIGAIQAGNAGNVIPPECVMRGTARDFNERVVGKIIEDSVNSIVKNVAVAYGATAEVRWAPLNYPCLVNHRESYECVLRASEKVLGKGKLISDNIPAPYGEDFAFYLQEKPGCFFFVGTHETSAGAKQAIHSSQFDFNDRVIPIGVKMYLAILEDRFGVELKI